ncbi:hypothetical protein ILYODFUR_012898 [Ilyodon furcidens]|uniref:NECAP endocytosis associated 1 n=1 Tax=Ilyodon furcidens TaxID=33524 RepID=A0ABV0U8W9_9TELE
MHLTSMWLFRTTSSRPQLNNVNCNQLSCKLFLFLVMLFWSFRPSFLVFLRWVKQENEFTKQAQAPDSAPKLDLGFKEGQTITLNIGQSKKKDRSRPQSSGGLGFLPPPPGGKLAPPPSSRATNLNTQTTAGGADTGCLLDLDSSNSNSVAPSNPTSTANNDLWGDFDSVTLK